MQEAPKSGILVFAHGDMRLTSNATPNADMIQRMLDHSAASITSFVRGSPSLRSPLVKRNTKRGFAAPQRRPQRTVRSSEIFQGTSIRLRPINQLGTYADVGKIETVAKGIKVTVDLLHCDLQEGSLRGQVGGVIGGGLLLAFGATAAKIGVDVYSFANTIETSGCVAEVRVSAATWTYAQALLSQLPPPPIPANSAAVQQNADSGVRDETTCIYQSLLRDEMKEFGVELRTDGIWGPQTQEAWDRFKAGLGKGVDDSEAAKQLLLRRRNSWGPIGTAIDAVTRQILNSNNSTPNVSDTKTTK